MSENQMDPQEAEAVDAVGGDDAPEAVETPEVTPEPEAPAYTDEDADEARLFGWKAPEEWQGEKPAGYIDNPQEFLDRVKRSRIFQTMETRIQQQEREQREAKDRLERINQKALERQRAQYEARLTELRTGRDRAAEEGDLDTYKRLSQQEQDLLKDAPKPEAEAPQAKTGLSPDIAAYSETDEGAWIKDEFLVRAGADVIEKTPGATYMTPIEQAKFARQRLASLYPERFGAQEARPKPKPRQTVDGGGLAVGGGASPLGAFGKLPGEAKAAFERFVKEGIYADTKADREEYAREYNA